MAFPQGIDFRSTAGFVTDPTGCDSEIGLIANYPRTTAQGNTVGWVTLSTGNARDRNAGNDARLAGTAFNNANATSKYRIDLPSTGSFDIRCALGDASYSRSVKMEVFDNTTSLGVLASGSTGAANSFKDATNVARTAAAWPGSNAATTLTFATTTAFFVFGTGAASDSFVAHINVAASGGGGTTLTVLKASLTLAADTTTAAVALTILHPALSLGVKNVTASLAMTLSKAALSLSGRAVTAATALSLTKASLTLTGKAVTYSAATALTISKAALTLAGRSVTLGAKASGAWIMRIGRRFWVGDSDDMDMRSH